MKTCRSCKEAKPDDQFYKGDGRCKPCRCIMVRANRLARIGYYRAYDIARATTPERKEKALLYQRNRRKQNPIKRIAWQKVNNALKTGKIVRPDRCSHCKVVGPVQAHHTDYSKPLDVVWCCFTCHRRVFHGQYQERKSA